MQVNTITNETMRDIIKALLIQQPAIEQTITPPTQTAREAPARNRQNIKIWVKPLSKPLSIAYSDVCFVSSCTNKILLPYHGKLPDELLLTILNEAVESLTVREVRDMQKRGTLDFKTLVPQFSPAIGLKPSRRKPLIVLQLDATTITGQKISRALLADARPRQVMDMLNRFFNRKKTGLRADICACLESQHVDYKRRIASTI